MIHSLQTVHDKEHDASRCVTPQKSISNGEASLYNGTGIEYLANLGPACFEVFMARMFVLSDESPELTKSVK